MNLEAHNFDAVVFAPYLTSRMIFMAEVLNYSGYTPIILTTSNKEIQNQDDQSSLFFLNKTKKFVLREISDVNPFKHKILVAMHAQFLPVWNWSESLKKWLSYSQDSVLLGRAIHRHYWGNLKFELRTTTKYFGLIRKFKHILYEDTPYFPSVFSLWMKQGYFGAVPFTEFICNKEKWNDLFSGQQFCNKRSLIVNFQGCLLPDSRKDIIESILANGTKDFTFCKSLNLDKHHSNYFLLIADDPNSPIQRHREHNEFIKILDQSYFTLCPPGYSGTTARVIEAIIRGSIPVLTQEELKFYDLPLIDEKNCILVKGYSSKVWIKKVNMIKDFPEDKITAMQKEVTTLFYKYLSSENIKMRMAKKYAIGTI